MKKFELTDDEFKTLEEIFDDWGSDCPYTDCEKFNFLAIKLGFRELEVHTVITKEEMERRNRFAEAMRPIMEATNHLLKYIKPFNLDVLYGEKSLIGSQLRIKLPNDYIVGK